MSSKLIIYPLTVLIFCSIMAQVQTTTMLSQMSIGQYNNPSPLAPQGFAFGMSWGDILALFIVVLTAGVLAGITVLGSGISEMSQTILYKTIFFLSLWGVFSAIALGILISIPIVGVVFYLCLTVAYVVGVQEQIGTHPS